MSEQKESSVLFNLKELMDLEEDRIKDEEEERRRAEEEERRRKEEEERRKREEEEARLRAEEEARLAEERKKREEEERKKREKEEAEMRVRLEAEAKARAAEQQRLLEHEREMAAIKAKEKKGIHPGIIVGLVVLLIGGAAGVYFGVIKPEQERAARSSVLVRRVAYPRAPSRTRPTGGRSSPPSDSARDPSRCAPAT